MDNFRSQEEVAKAIMEGNEEQAYIHSQKDSKYRLLTIDIHTAQNEGEDYYFKVNGIPVRVAWLERDKDDQYKAALIINEMITGQGRIQNVGSLH